MEIILNILRIIATSPKKRKEIKEEMGQISQGKISGIIDTLEFLRLIETNERTKLIEITELGRKFLEVSDSGIKAETIIEKGLDRVLSEKKRKV